MDNPSFLALEDMNFLTGQPPNYTIPRMFEHRAHGKLTAIDILDSVTITKLPYRGLFVASKNIALDETFAVVKGVLEDLGRVERTPVRGVENEFILTQVNTTDTSLTHALHSLVPLVDNPQDSKNAVSLEGVTEPYIARVRAHFRTFQECKIPVITAVAFCRSSAHPNNITFQYLRTITYGTLDELRQ